MMKKELIQLINKLQNSIVQEQEVLDNPTCYHYNDVLQARTIVNTTKFAIKEINELIKKTKPMNPTTAYIPCTMSESDVIANHPQGALPLKQVENVYVMDEADLKALWDAARDKINHGNNQSTYKHRTFDKFLNPQSPTR